MSQRPSINPEANRTSNPIASRENVSVCNLGCNPVGRPRCSHDQAAYHLGLQLDLLGYGKRVVYLDAEIAHRAFQLRVPERVGFILRISFLIENQRPSAHRSVLAVAMGRAGR
jgi:hypothetical protein